MKDYFKYRYKKQIEFNLKEKTHLTILGNSSDFFVNTLLHNNDEVNVFVGDKELNNDTLLTIRKRMCVVLNKHLNVFVGVTVKDEIAFGLESLAMSKNDIHEIIDSYSKRFKIDSILEKDPNSLGSSDKAKMKILSYLIIKPNILVLDNILCELDYNDKLLVVDILKEYVSNGGIVINVTSDVEEALYSDKIIILYDNSLVCEGKTLSVLNEEKILKRLGIGLPFIIELNKYFMDYGIIDKYHLSEEKLVGALWK